MKTYVLKAGSTFAALVAAALWTGSASAIVTTCVNGADDAYMELSTNGSATIACWDAGDQANPGSLPTSISGPGTFNDGTLNLPTGTTGSIAKSDGVNSSFFNISSGSLTGGQTGVFGVDATGSLALLFKSGGGNNTPSWWLYSITGLAAGELFTWKILGVPPINNLSHVEAFGGTTTIRVPEPMSLSLFGVGLVALAAGVKRRRPMKLESARA